MGPAFQECKPRSRSFTQKEAEQRVKQLNELAREYEARHFPPTRRLDLQGEGPDTARQRALRWIQTFAHEQPGSDLLLVVERNGGRSGASPVRRSVERLLEQLDGGLIDGWGEFGPGSIALRIADEPRFAPTPEPKRENPKEEGRTPETAGAAPLSPEADIPPELLPLARRAAELRRTREALSVGLLEVVLRKLWIEAQAAAMSEETDWGVALEEILREEERLAYAEE